ncbi:MAG: helicase HerA domain-containing protein [Candidatus Hydrothermarchaeales archaeon]
MAGIVGIIFGEVGYGDFNFVVSEESNLQKGTYVKVKHEGYGWVLAQVSSIKRYNELYTLNTITAATPKEIADSERMIANARVIGYLDNKNMLKVPKIPFKPGAKVYFANSTLIRSSLGLKKKAGGIYIGLLDGHNSTPVYLDINRLIQKHVSILAKTGAGKSYTIGVLIEELLEKKIPAIVIDPHGEYVSLKNPNRNPRELELMRRFGISPKGYENIVEYTPYLTVNPGADKKFALDVTHLSTRDFIEMLPTRVTDTQKGILFEAIKTVRGFGKYSIEDLLRVIKEHEGKAKWNLVTSLEMVRESKIFEGKATTPKELAKKGIASIINLRGVQPDIQELIVTRVTNELFEARKKGTIPPLLLLLEEAHNFCPERGVGRALSSRIIRTVASEGRKFGLGLCVVSQRPARVDKNVLSQCNTQIILKVTNPNDMRALSQSIEGFTQDLEEEIKQLQPGVALVVGEAIEQPIFVDIRVKRSQHGGVSIDVVREPTRRPVHAPRFEGLIRKLFFR